MRAISFSLVLVLVVSLQIVAGNTSSAFTKLMSNMINDEYDDTADDDSKFTCFFKLLIYTIFTISEPADADRLQRRSSDFPMAQFKRQHDQFMHDQLAGIARRSSFGQFYPEA